METRELLIGETITSESQVKIKGISDQIHAHASNFQGSLDDVINYSYSGQRTRAISQFSRYKEVLNLIKQDVDNLAPILEVYFKGHKEGDIGAGMGAAKTIDSFYPGEGGSGGGGGDNNFRIDNSSKNNNQNGDGNISDQSDRNFDKFNPKDTTLPKYTTHVEKRGIINGTQLPKYDGFGGNVGPNPTQSQTQNQTQNITLPGGATLGGLSSGKVSPPHTGLDAFDSTMNEDTFKPEEAVSETKTTDANDFNASIADSSSDLPGMTGSTTFGKAGMIAAGVGSVAAGAAAYANYKKNKAEESMEIDFEEDDVNNSQTADIFINQDQNNFDSQDYYW